MRVEAITAEANGETGTRLHFFVVDQSIAKYFDTEPLAIFKDGGRVAYWTVDGAIMMVCGIWLQSTARRAPCERAENRQCFRIE